MQEDERSGDEDRSGRRVVARWCSVTALMTSTGAAVSTVVKAIQAVKELLGR